MGRGTDFEYSSIDNLYVLLVDIFDGLIRSWASALFSRCQCLVSISRRHGLDSSIRYPFIHALLVTRYMQEKQHLYRIYILLYQHFVSLMNSGNMCGATAHKI